VSALQTRKQARIPGGEQETVQKLAMEATPRRNRGSVQFDDRGNARWVPHEEASTGETMIRLLDIDWMELVDEDEGPEVRREGFVEVYRTPLRR
jgi:hypothetical protein